MDILAEHGVAGVIGLIFNALFGADWVIGMDGTTEHEGGWVTHNYKQMYKQIAYIAASIGYTAAVTAIICFVLGYIPGMRLRISEEAEEAGMDEDQIGEFAYDYVEVRRDYYLWGVDEDSQRSDVNHRVNNAHLAAERSSSGTNSSSDGNGEMIQSEKILPIHQEDPANR